MKKIKNLVILKSKTKSFPSIKNLFQLKIQILIKQWGPIRSLLVKESLKISLATKMLKKLDLYVYFCPKWLHKDFDKTKFMSFLIKDDELVKWIRKV